MTAKPVRSRSAMASRIAIIGGGIVGLTLAWRLARRGFRVTLAERDVLGAGASRVAGGMLAADLEAEPSEESLHGLALESRNLWPRFAAELAADSGVEELGLRREGTIWVAGNRDDLARLRRDFARLRGLGCALTWLEGREVCALEPALNPAISGGIRAGADGQIDPRAVVAALRVALSRLGARTIEGVEAGVAVEGGRAVGMTLGARTVAADFVVLAAGAWSRLVPGIPEAARPPVKPMKGQLVVLEMDPAAPLISHVVWASGCYLIPRRDGRLFIGATMEEKGFDGRVTAGGVLSLIEAAWRALPGVEDLPLIETCAGFRPRSRDDAPILGEDPDLPGLIHANGHHRNGILLAPVTAELVTTAIATGEMPALGRGFAPGRFRNESAPR